MMPPDALNDHDAQERAQALHSPDERDRQHRRWLLQQQFTQDLQRGADSQELIKLMNRIKALERGEVSE